MTDGMETDITTFGQARVRLMAMVTEVCADESCPIASVLDKCVDQALMSRWSNPVKTYIPLLAFREVQECIRLGYCPGSTVELIR